MSVVDEQKKERIRLALQELEHRTCKMGTCEAMRTLHRAICDDFGATGAFAGDDDFKEEIFSARVIQIVMEASQDKKELPPAFYHHAFSTLYFLCKNNTELATTFVENSGNEFLLECLETFSSDQFLLATCFMVYRGVIGSLDTNESVAFAGMILGKLVDVYDLNYETADEGLYYYYCHAVGSSFGPGSGELIHNLFQQILSHVWHGVMTHKHDEDAQDIGRSLLRNLVGDDETVKKMIEHAELHHCEEEECAGCA
jgi:hypothetical protein